METLDPTGAVGDLLKYKSETEHPLMIFGSGVYQFFFLVETLIIIFFFMSCFAYYQLGIIENENKNYLDQSSATLGRILTATTLGSFSGIEPLCWKVPLTEPSIKIQCYGDRYINEIFDVGILRNSTNNCQIDELSKLMNPKKNEKDYVD